MHIDEKILELYACSPEQLTQDEKNKIINHLTECCYCNDVYNTYQNLFRGIKDSFNNEPDELDNLLAEKIGTGFSTLNRKYLPQKNDSIKIYDAEFEIIDRNPAGIIKKAKYWIKRNPIKSVTYSFAFSFLLFFLVLSIVRKNNFENINPVTLKLNDFILEAYNINGDLLWKKNLDNLRGNIDSLMGINYQYRNLLLDDIDGNKFNEVLLTGSNPDYGLYRRDTLYCFNYDGSLRWKAAPESQTYNYAPKWKRTKWVITHFLLAQREKKKLLFVVAHDDAYGGCVISTLDPSNGKVTSSLYHSGYITAAANFDIDSDSNDEIFFAGVSSYYKPFLMVIKRDTLMGVMPDFYSTGHKVLGNASYYILFPLTELAAELSKTKSIEIRKIEKFQNKGITVFVSEFVDNHNDASLQYTLDENYGIKYINASTPYLYYFEKIKKIKVTSPDIINNYLNTYKDSLLYWDGDKFVNYPVQNKYWNQKFRLPN